ncbi:MAG: bifunctional riboflavin kinase/FAD synthetase [Hyphomicrobiales bacterium]|nr:bifunctional riboflavin kinase/FAD synthetase [Hyphomicrobiales bacterium]MCP5371145.1 bifunctional riboflavin kinase/FAD synthetase [Hyphomicrobiales bacterium]
MRIYRHYDALPAEVRGAAVAVGNFDGVHRGHQAVIGEAGRHAQATGAPWAVLTFEPHPRDVFQPGGPPYRLTPFRVKAHHVAALGVDTMVTLHFDKAFSQRSAEDFVNDVLLDGLGVSHVVCGYDFVFGHGRRGNSEMLLQRGIEQGFGFTCVPAVRDGQGEIFSSTRVRELLAAGDALGAAHVLGRHYEVDGRVEHGARLGRTIGFPTANLPLGEYAHPRRGVYAIRAGIDAGGDTVWHEGVANLGTRPTVDGTGVLLEAHLFDFDGDLYGRNLRVALLDFIRPERKFAGLDALKAQIGDDCAAARRILSRP